MKKHDHKKEHASPLNRELRREWAIMRHIRDENKALFVGFIWLLIAIIVLNTIFVVARLGDRDDNKQPTVYASHILTSQQHAQTAAFATNISNVYETAQPDQAFPLEANETMLILDLTITNKTAVEQNFYPVNQLFVRDQEGGTYPPHASMYVTRPIAAQAVKPGQSVSGQISFAVPKQLTRPLMYVDLRWDNQAPVVFDVLH